MELHLIGVEGFKVVSEIWNRNWNLPLGQVELQVSALPSTKVDEDEQEFTAQLELIETTHQDTPLHEVIRIQGSITISF